MRLVPDELIGVRVLDDLAADLRGQFQIVRAFGRNSFGTITGP